MIAQRAFLSGPVSGVCIVVAATAAFFGSVVSGQAQVDPNIQTQANILSAPIVLVPLSPSESAAESSKLSPEILKALGTTGPCKPTEKQVRKTLDRIIDERPPSDKRPKPETASAPVLTIFGKLSLEEQVRFRTLSGIPSPSAPYCHGQPTTVKASLQFNPTYETNALKTGANGSSDGSLDAGGGLLVTAGLGETRPYDLIYLNMQTASARYATYSAKGLDTFTAQAGYQYVLHDYYFDEHGNPVSLDEKHIPANNVNKAVTFDTVSFGILNQTTYEPNFRKGTADLFTPQVTLGRQNFDLAAPDALCSLSRDWPKDTSKNFCYYLDIALTLGQSFSDVPTLQNANAAISATVGNRLDGTDWTLAAQAVVTSRSYENVPGGRQDYLIQVGPLLSYSHAPTVTSFGSMSFAFSLPVSYYQNYSNISKDAWSGIIVQPTFTIAFLPPAPVK